MVCNDLSTTGQVNSIGHRAVCAKETHRNLGVLPKQSSLQLIIRFTALIIVALFISATSPKLIASGTDYAWEFNSYMDNQCLLYGYDDSSPGYWGSPLPPNLPKFPSLDAACEAAKTSMRACIEFEKAWLVAHGYETIVPTGYYGGQAQYNSSGILYQAKCSGQNYTYTPYVYTPSLDESSDGDILAIINQVRLTGLYCPPPKAINNRIGSCQLPSDDTKNPPDDPCNSTPKPINILTGNKYLDVVDVPSIGSSPLQFIRHYNSVGNYQYQNSFGTAGKTRNPLGPRWTHNYYQGLTVSANEVRYSLNNGQTFIFKPVSGSWQPDADVDYHLEELTTTGNRTGWKVTTPDDEIETYSAIGDVQTITNPQGISQTLTYSCKTVNASCPMATPAAIAPYEGFLIRVTDSFGRSLNFTYNDYGKMVSMTDPAGKVTSYQYNSNDALKTVIYPDETPTVSTDNPKKTYIYGDDIGELTNSSNVVQPFVLTGIVDENGIRYATYRYNGEGKAISEYANGNIDNYGLVYAPDGSNTAVTDPLGSIRTTHLTTVLGVVKSTGTDQPGGSGCSAASSAITYDANGNIASRTDFNGHRTNYTHDLTRNLETSRIEGLTAADTNTPQTRVVTTEWHPTFRLPTKITEPGLETSYSYDSKGNITSKGLRDLVTNKVKQWATSYTYSANGILLQKVEDGPRTDAPDLTTYDYYPEDAACTGGHLGCRGQLKQITDALGHTTRITRYSANGQLEVTIDPNGLTTTMAYDVRQRLISLDVGGELTTYTYDPAGLMTRVTQPNAAYLAYRFDNAHRLIEVKDQLGNTRTYTLDNMGNRVKEDLTDPNGQLARSQTKVYDALSRLQNLVLPQ
jgi:YD repeat-containing protein